MNKKQFQKGNQKQFLITKICSLVGVILIIAGLGIQWVPKMLSSFESPKEDGGLSESLTHTTSFWVADFEKDTLALFDMDGNQLTDFIYDSHDIFFINGVTWVKTKDDQYGLIDTTGKLVVDLGQYQYIFSEGGNYRATDSDHNSYILNSSGKMVRMLEEDEEFFDYVDGYTYSIIESKDDYTIIDYNGETILTLPKQEDEELSESYMNSQGDYLSIFYGEKNYIINLATKQVEIEIPDQHYCIDSIKDNDMIVYACGPIDSEYSSEYKWIRDGKVIYSTTLDSSEKLEFSGDDVILVGKSSWMLDENGNKVLEISNAFYIDDKNYIIEDEDDWNTLHLYVDGNLKDNLKCYLWKWNVNYSVYWLECTDERFTSGSIFGEKILFNSDGTRVNDKNYELAYGPDENGNSVVTEDRENYYLINIQGERISGDYADDNSYNKIYPVDGMPELYRATRKDGLEAIFKINGDDLITGDEIRTEVASNGKTYAIVKRDTTYSIYDLSNMQELVTVDGKPYMRKEYFTTSLNNKTQYYSYTTGKMFYEGVA